MKQAFTFLFVGLLSTLSLANGDAISLRLTPSDSTTHSARNYPDCTAPADPVYSAIGVETIRVVWNDVAASPGKIHYEIRMLDRRTGNWKTHTLNSGYHFTQSFAQSNIDRVEVRKVCIESDDDYTYYSDWVEAVALESSATPGDPEICESFNGGSLELNGENVWYIDVAGPELEAGQYYLLSYQYCDDNIWHTINIGTATTYMFGPDLNQDIHENLICIFEIDLIYGSDASGPLSCGEFVIHNQVDIPDYDCNDPFELPEIDGTTPLPTASNDDVFFIGGFAIDLTQVAGGNGSFTGKGHIELPFQNKIILVEFVNISVNTSYQVHQGQVRAVSGDTNYHITNSTHLPAEICNDPEDVPGFGEDGTHSGTGEAWDENGFGADSTYSRMPPYPGYEEGDSIDINYDPCGFDMEGIHIETGDFFNPDGCSRAGFDRDNNPCTLDCVPYYWMYDQEETNAGINFAKHIDAVLDSLLAVVLDSLALENQNALADKRSACQMLRTEMENIVSAEGLDPLDIFGENNDYLNEGLSSKFSKAPQVPESDIDRNENFEDLEKKHVELFDCDVIVQQLIANADSLSRLSTDPELTEIMDAILYEIRALPEDDIAAFENDISVFVDWLTQWLIEYIHALNDAGDIGYHDERSRFERLSNMRWSPTNIALASTPYIREMLLSKSPLPAGGGSPANLLPVELITSDGGFDYRILLDDLIFHPDHATLSAYAVLDFPISGERIILRADGIQFNPSGVTGPSELRLDTDMSLRINNAAALYLKKAGTFVTWDCNGFKSIELDAEIRFCRNILTPMDPATWEPLPDDSTHFVTGTFSTTINGWHDFTVSVGITPFAVTTAPHVGWAVSEAHLDLSDLESPDVEFPKAYESPFVVNNKPTPLWRGFFIASIDGVLLDDAIADTSQGRVSFGAQNVIIDDRGFSGAFFLNANILSLDNGSLGGWAYSIDSLGLYILYNHLKRGSFGGSVHVPIFKSKGSAPNTITKADCFDYVATMHSDGKLQFVVSPQETLEVPIWLGSAAIDNTSKLTIDVDGGASLVAVLHGSVEFNEDIGDILKIDDAIRFENVTLSNEAPYFRAGTWDLPFEEIGMQFKGFSANVNNIQLGDGENAQGQGEAALSFDMEVHLVKSLQVSAKGNFELLGVLDQDLHGRHLWKYDDFRVNGLHIDADIKGNKIVGGLTFFDGHSTYGDGFRGVLQARFKAIQSDVSAVGLFGQTSYQYFMVDVLAQFDNGLPIVGPLQMTGIGGGLSYHMSRANELTQMPMVIPDSTALPSQIGQSLSGEVYTPDQGSGLSLRALLPIAMKKENLFNGTVRFEVAFNSSSSNHSGIKSIGLEGVGKFMKAPDFLQKVSALPDSILTNITGKPQDVDAAVSAWVKIGYNFNEKTLDGQFGVFFDVGAGILTGSAIAEIHIGPSEWYFNLGRTKHNPSGRAYLEMDIAVIHARVETYFNVGTAVPGMPRLPRKVRRLFGNVALADPLRKTGRGFAHGVNASFELNADFFIGSIRFEAGFGYDLLVKDYGEVICTNTGEPLGIDGWYASGQAWVYASGEIRLFGAKLLSASAGILVQGGFPNPSWVQGRLKLRYKIIIVKGSATVKITAGTRCQTTDTPPDGLGHIIWGTFPENGAIDFDVLGEMNAIFDLPVERPFKYGAGQQSTTYNIKLKKAVVRHIATGNEWPMDLEWGAGNVDLFLRPAYVLNAKDSFNLEIEVHVLKNNAFQRAESRIVGFRTGNKIENIPAYNIEATYPVDGMQNFYRKEWLPEKGYIQLHQGQPDLLADGPDTGIEMRLYSSPLQYRTLDWSYNHHFRRVEFDLSSSLLTPGHIYRLEFVEPIEEEGASIPDIPEDDPITDLPGMGQPIPVIPASKSSDPNESKHEYWIGHFRVSMYDKFFDKVTDVWGQSVVNTSSRSGYSIFREYNIDLPYPIEPFDAIELEGSGANDGMMSIKIGLFTYTASDATPFRKVEDDFLSHLWKNKKPVRIEYHFPTPEPVEETIQISPLIVDSYHFPIEKGNDGFVLDSLSTAITEQMFAAPSTHTSSGQQGLIRIRSLAAINDIYRNIKFQIRLARIYEQGYLNDYNNGGGPWNIPVQTAGPPIELPHVVPLLEAFSLGHPEAYGRMPLYFSYKLPGRHTHTTQRRRVYMDIGVNQPSGN